MGTLFRLVSERGREKHFVLRAVIQEVRQEWNRGSLLPNEGFFSFTAFELQLHLQSRFVS